MFSQEERAELTDHIGNKGLARLGMPGEGDAAVGNEVEEEIIDISKNTNSKLHCLHPRFLRSLIISTT